QWEAFLAALGHAFNNEPFTVSEVTRRLLDGQQHRLRETLPDYLADALDGGEGQFRKRLGKAFEKHVDVRYGDAGLYLSRAAKDIKKNVNRWRVERYQGPTVQDDALALAQSKQHALKAATNRDEAVTVDAAPATSQARVEDTLQEFHMGSTAEVE